MTRPDLATRDRSRSAAAARRIASPSWRAFGAALAAIVVLGILVWSVFSRGVHALSWDFFTKGPALFGQTGRRRRARARRQPAARRDRDRDGAAGRRSDRDLRQRVRAAADRRAGAPVARRPERLPVDRDRHLRLRALRQDQPADRRVGPPSERDRRAGSRSRSSCCRSSRGRRWRCSRSSRTSCETRATRSASRSGRPCCASCCRPRSAASSPERRSRSRARPARRRRSSSRACSPAQTVDWNPTHSVNSIPYTIFQYSESPDPGLHEQAWALAFVLIAFVLADEPDRAVPARALAAQARRAALTRFLPAFTGPSPAGNNASAHAARLARHIGAMTKPLMITLAAVSGRTRRRDRGDRNQQGHDDHRRRQHVRLAARLGLDARARHGVRLQRPVQRCRLRRRHRGGLQPAGRLRRLGRAADARPGDGLQELRADSVGALGDVRRLQRPGAPVHLNLDGKTISKIFLGQITNWNDPAIGALNKGANLPGPEDHADLPLGRLGHDVQLHRLPSSVNPEFKSKVGNSTAVTFPTGIGARGSAGVAGLVSRTSGGITYVDVAFAITNHIKFAAVRNAAGKFLFPSLRRIQAAAARVPEGAGVERDAHREPAEVGAARVPDLDLHLRDRAAADVTLGGAAQADLLGADPGSDSRSTPRSSSSCRCRSRCSSRPRRR